VAATPAQGGRTTPNVLEENGWFVDLRNTRVLEVSHDPLPAPTLDDLGYYLGDDEDDADGDEWSLPPDWVCPDCRTALDHNVDHLRALGVDDETIEAVRAEARRRGYDVDAEDERDHLDEADVGHLDGW
jgi:hypothetical protein